MLRDGPPEDPIDVVYGPTTFDTAAKRLIPVGFRLVLALFSTGAGRGGCWGVIVFFPRRPGTPGAVLSGSVKEHVVEPALLVCVFAVVVLLEVETHRLARVCGDVHRAGDEVEVPSPRSRAP